MFVTGVQTCALPICKNGYKTSLQDYIDHIIWVENGH
jgi:hypothetical protein